MSLVIAGLRTRSQATPQKGFHEIFITHLFFFLCEQPFSSRLEFGARMFLLICVLNCSFSVLRVVCTD